MKNIVVPVDFSTTSRTAYKFALNLARKMKCTLYLLHVIEQPGVNSWTLTNNNLRLPQHIESNIYFVELVKKTKHDIDKFRESEDTTDVNVETLLRMGKAYQNIADTIHDCHPDMIIMGSKGEDDILDTLVGSNAEKVVRNAPCPVIVLKEEIELESLTDIVLASEFNEKMENIISFLKKLQKTLEVRLHLVLVSTPTSFESTHNGKERIAEFVKKHNIENYESHVYSDFTEEEGIVAYADSIEADMIAMTTNGRSPFVQFFSGSIATEVVNHARKAVITLRIND